MSKNAEGWIRHRGSKCPVEKGTLIDVRFRNGDIVDGVKALERDGGAHVYGWCAGVEFWKKDDVSADIMAYRLHKPAEQPKPFIEAVQAFNALAKVPQLDGPLQWRDRITELDFLKGGIDDAYQSQCAGIAEERADLVQKLASEGFALIGRVVESVEDMSDWRNWKVGDLIERVSNKKISGMPLNEPMEINRMDEKAPDQPAQVGNGLWPYLCDVKWHSRPSA